MNLATNSNPFQTETEEDLEQVMNTTPPSWKNNFTFFGLILTAIFLITSLGILLWMIAEQNRDIAEQKRNVANLVEELNFNARALKISTKILAERSGDENL